MMLTLGIDQERLGYARPDKIYVELEDTKRPKNVLKFDKDIPYKDGEIGKTGTIDSPDVIVKMIQIQWMILMDQF